MEQWIPVPDYPDYQVSNLGRIASLKRGVFKILKLHPNTDGYLGFSIWSNGKNKTFYIHRLVARCFLGQPLDFTEVDHIDRNRSNNTATNLRYVTRSQQCMNREMPVGKLGERYIRKMSAQYWLRIRRNKVHVISKGYDTLEQAITARENFLLQEQNGTTEITSDPEPSFSANPG